jgi:two-component system, NarL family, sensor kinase
MQQKLFLYFLLFISIDSYAQVLNNYDSIEKTISHLKEDTLLIEKYFKAGEVFELDSPSLAQEYYNKGLQLSKRLNYKKGEATYVSYAIVLLNNAGKYKEGLQLTLNAMDFFKTTGSAKDLVTGYVNIANQWQYLGDLNTAADLYLKAAALLPQINDNRRERVVYNNLASVFIELKDMDKGILYGEKALVVANKMKDDYAIASCLINLAIANVYKGNTEKPRKYYNEVISIAEKLDDYILKLDALTGLGEVEFKKENYILSNKYYVDAIALSIKRNTPEYELIAENGVALNYFELKEYEKALLHSEKAIAIAKNTGSMQTLEHVYKTASEIAEKQQQPFLALEFYKKYNAVKDSLIGEKTKSNVYLYEIKYETEKKEIQLKLQQSTIKQKNTLNILFGSIAAAVVCLSLFGFKNYKHKQTLQQQKIAELETRQKLTATEAVLKGEEQERTRLAKDLHDGLGGMLSGIKYSFNTMKGNMIMTPDNAQAFERSIDMLDSSIKEMRRVAHNMMPEALVKFGLNTALKDFCNEIQQSGALNISYQSIGLENEIIDQTVGIAVYRIVQELINNTMKHAVAKNAIVQVTKSDNTLSVTVEDDGKGFDTAIINKPAGMGWSNITNRVEFLKGKLDVDSQSGKGTSVHIEINI